MKKYLFAAVLALFAGGASAEEAGPITIATGQDPSLGIFYVAAQEGIFAKNGLDVKLQSGPAGSAMVSLLIGNQVQVAHAAEQAGLVNYNLDKNVVVAAQGSQALRFFGVVGRNIASMDELKGKKIGVTIGSGSEQFWRALVEKLKLDAKDYTVVPVDPPEMVAALERGNIDAAATWEPWVSRALEAVSDTKVLHTNEGVFTPQNLIYFNRGWAEKNPQAAAKVMASLIEATARINADPDGASKVIGAYLKMDPAFTKTLMAKAAYDIRLDQGTVDSLRAIEMQIAGTKRLPKPIEWTGLIYPDILKAAAPDKVSAYTLPK